MWWFISYYVPTQLLVLKVMILLFLNLVDNIFEFWIAVFCLRKATGIKPGLNKRNIMTIDISMHLIYFLQWVHYIATPRYLVTILKGTRKLYILLWISRNVYVFYMLKHETLDMWKRGDKEHMCHKISTHNFLLNANGAASLNSLCLSVSNNRGCFKACDS